MLVNLGTPNSPETKDVRIYLREFLSDPYVIDIPKIQRWLLVNLIIAPFRSPKSAKAYQEIWTEKGSPLLTNGEDLRDELRHSLGNEWQVELGMRYGEPSLETALKQFSLDDDILVLLLYPQYANASSLTALDKLNELSLKRNHSGKFNIIESFYVDEDYIDALSLNTAPYLAEFQPDHVLMSYHGLPVRQLPCANDESLECVHKENPCPKVDDKYPNCYRAQCYETSRALAKKLNIQDWSQSFQSRLGSTPWIKPYTDQHIETLIQNGVKRLAVLCPSFVADCLETLEEVNIRLRSEFIEKGGEDFFYIPCLNSEKHWVKAITKMLHNKML